MSIFWRKNIFCENTGAGFCFTQIFRVAMTSIPAGSCHSQTDIPPCGGRWSSNHCRCNAVILPAYCGGTACPCSCSLSCLDTRPSLSGGFICLFCLDAEPPRFRHRDVLPHCHAADVEFGNDSSFQPLHFCIQRFAPRFYQLLLLL